MKRNNCLLTLGGIGLSLICLVFTLVLGAVQMLRMARAAYGAPAPGLGLSQTLYLSTLLVLERNDLTLPADPYGPQQTFEVPLGASIPQITSRLQDAGLVPNATALRHYLIYAGLDTRLQAGEYRLSPQMTPLEIAQTLLDATPRVVTFHVLPGWRNEEIAAAIPTSGFSFTPEEFLVAATLPPITSTLASSLPPGATAQGFLLPGTYELSRTLSAGDFVAALMDRFSAEVGPDLQAGWSAHGLDMYQAVTLASIVEREAIVDEEMPLIASVFLNRLSSGLKLESDPTVQYALGYDPNKQSWWINPLSLENLRFDSPYNTYIYPGLPPGPIAHPSLRALRAVAFPALSPYYYFRAACDGSGLHTFAETFEEHLNNACP